MATLKTKSTLNQENRVEQKKEITRRGFLKLMGKGAGAAVGINLLNIPGFQKLLAEELTHIPVVWIAAGSCTGCSISLLNSLSPTIQDLLLGQLVPGKHVSLAFHPIVMAGQGDQIIGVLDKFKSGKSGSFILVLEGAVSTKDNGVYCEVGEKNGHGITTLQHLKELSSQAMVVLNVGTCPSYGGIPGASPNPTGIKTVKEILKTEGISTPVVNISGCPPHPDWIVGTIATILIGGPRALKVDALGRPIAFYGKKIHDNCPLRGQFDKGNFAKKFSDKECLYELGCKGPVTYADCSTRMWNSSTNWCIGSGSPCVGCVEPDFPYINSMLEKVDIHAANETDSYKKSKSVFINDKGCTACHMDNHRGQHPTCTDCHTTRDWRVDIW